MIKGHDINGHTKFALKYEMYQSNLMHKNDNNVKFKLIHVF